MDRKVRLPQGIRNFVAGSLFSLISGVMMFLSRIVFLKYMTVDYVGFSSLFEHVFLLVSVVDCGVNTSLTSFMSRALASDNDEKKNGVLREAKKIYLIVSAVMMTLFLFISLFFMGKKGLFLPSLLYFIGQCAQYYLGWRALALNVSGRNDVVSRYVHIGRGVGSVLEMVVITLTRSFTLYIAASMVSVILSYLLLFFKAGSVCKWIDEKKGVIDKKEEKYLFKMMPSMASHRFGCLFFRSYEIIAVNLIFGFTIGGRYSNLLLISTAFMTLFWIFQSSVTGIVGEHYAVEGRKDTYSLYRKMSFYNLLVSFLASLIFLLFGREIGALSFGEENIVMETRFMALEMFLLSSRTTLLVLRDAMGDYHRDWWKPLLEAISVIILTLLLRESFYYQAIPLSISITLLVLSIPVDTLIIIHRLKGKVSTTMVSVLIPTIVLSLILLVLWSFFV
ncbi:MAG: lipopolysaccharide biosynthesis protein [Candidatus Ornithospirochaeta sp.]